MNANELADELERLYQQDLIDGVADLAMPEAATMLRQQQAKFEELKKDSKRLDWIWKEAQYSCFKLEKVRLFTVSTQHFTNVYGIRPMIDEAMEIEILRKAQEK